MSETNPTPAAIETPAPSEAAPAPQVALPPTSVVAPEPQAPTAEPPATPASEAPKSEATPAQPTAETTPEPTPEPVAAPTYTALKLPDGLTARPEALAEATKLFGEFNIPESGAQKLLDMHGAALKAAVDGAFKTATDFWEQKSKDWVAEVRADPQIGGNRFDTSIRRARAVWNETVPNEADRTRLFNDLTDTKIGDHPILTKAISEVGRRFEQVLQLTGTNTWADAMRKLREPAAPPPGNPARAPGSAGRPADRRYNRGA